MVWLGVEPMFENLRRAAPFEAMLRRIGLEKRQEHESY
jgi:hypothetical protein